MDNKKPYLGTYAVPVSDEFQIESEISFLKTDPPIGGGDNPGEEQGGDD